MLASDPFWVNGNIMAATIEAVSRTVRWWAKMMLNQSKTPPPDMPAASAPTNARKTTSRAPSWRSSPYAAPKSNAATKPTTMRISTTAGKRWCSWMTCWSAGSQRAPAHSSTAPARATQAPGSSAAKRALSWTTIASMTTTTKAMIPALSRRRPLCRPNSRRHRSARGSRNTSWMTAYAASASSSTWVGEGNP
jgi:hypothetical protein